MFVVLVAVVGEHADELAAVGIPDGEPAVGVLLEPAGVMAVPQAAYLMMCCPTLGTSRKGSAPVASTIASARSAAPSTLTIPACGSIAVASQPRRSCIL